MRVTLSELHRWAPVPSDASELAGAFVKAGFEVDDIHHLPPVTGVLLTATVLDINELTEFKKPIRFCQVDTGREHGVRGIICGATNFAVGDTVIVALPGAVLPGGFSIAARKTYGHISEGMICSASELGISDDHDGILVLDADTPAGVDAREVYGADEAIIELSVNPDRGYAMSVRGLAREMATAFDKPFTDHAAGALREVDGPAYPVRIDDESACSRFVTVTLTGVDPDARSPMWLRRAVSAFGMRPISVIVDITNYVMMAYGQPIHAYDAARLAGPIVVRRASAGQELTTLDAAVRTLADGDIVICDDSGIIGLAGVMGGLSTEIGPDTTEVVIEAANFDPAAISRTARGQKLPSEASKRFERGVDPAVTAHAAEYVAELICRYAGGSIVGGRTDVARVGAPTQITLPTGEPERLIGRPFTADEINTHLAAIGAVVQASDTACVVTVPSWRPDVTRPADLVEEIARLAGYDSIPSVLPQPVGGQGLSLVQRRDRALADDLASAGLIETLTFPFIGAGDLDALGLADDDVRRATVALRNPLDAHRGLLRTSLLSTLLPVVATNIARGNRNLALYEIGQIFCRKENASPVCAVPVDRRPTEDELAQLDAALPLQPRHLAAVLVGEVDASGWWGPGRVADWADAVELTRRIGRGCGVEVHICAAELMPWHPGRCAQVQVGGFPVGHAGELHPAVIERLGLPARTCALELNLDRMGTPGIATGPTLGAFPPVLVDVALTVDRQIPAADVLAALASGGGELLESVRLFDTYTGSQVEPGQVSLAFTLVVRSAHRTLTGAEANEVRDAATAAAARLGAKVRT